MDPIAPAPRPLSVVAAAQQAIEIARVRLFPLRIERWLALGVVAMLDQCGRGSAGGNVGFPGGGPGGTGSPGSSSGSARAADELSQAWGWIHEHLAILIAAAVAVLALVIALIAIVTFLRSRGVFMYIDDVATGRADIVRPWHEHRDKAWSFFAWSFGTSLVGLALALVLAVPLVMLIVSMIRSGASCAPVGGVVAIILLFIAMGLTLALFGVFLRDFVAPIQMALGVPCGPAIRVAWGLVKGNPLTFLGYLGLKLVFAIAAGILALVAGCFTCCIGFLPVIRQTLLQPVYYFERAWSMLLLRQAGYDLFPPGAFTPPAPPPLAPPPPLPPPQA